MLYHVRKPVRVVHVVASVAPRDGGPSTAVLNIDRALRLQGMESVVLATVADGPRARLNNQTERPMDDNGATVWFCRRSRPYVLKASWQQFIRLWKIAARSDVIHIHGVYLANSLYAYLVARIRRRPYVVHPHGTLEPYQENTRKRRKLIFNALIGNRILRGASAVFACSQLEADNLAARGGEFRVVKVPLGSSPVTPSEPAWARDALGSWLAEDKPKRVIFLGRLAKKKRPDVLLDAWVKCRAAGVTGALAFVGPQEDWTHGALAARLPPEGDQRNVVFCPTATPAEVAWLLEHAGIFVLPSENENFGISVVEAMRHGCAVIVTSETGASEHVRAAGAGTTLDRLTVESVASALEDLLGDSVDAVHKGDAGRALAERDLTWDAVARSMVAVYAGVT